MNSEISLSQQERIELINDLLSAWNERDIDRLLTMLSPDVEWYDLGMLRPPARGHEEVRTFAYSTLTAFPDFHYDIQGPICFAPDSSRCTVVWRITATHTGVLDPPGFYPTNRRVSFNGVDVLEFCGQKVCRITTLFDLVSVAEQLIGFSFRPPRNTIRERLTVWVQRILAFIVRILSRKPAS